MWKREPDVPACPQCGATLKHVRTITHLSELPDIQIFYCAAPQYVETIKLERAAEVMHA
jgi:hypothetical protein